VPCPSSDRPNTAFSAQAGRIQFDSRFVIPTFINGVSVTTLRGSGHSGTLLVDHSLVSRDQFVPGRTIRLKGALNNEFVEIPIARVLFRSPKLGCTGGGRPASVQPRSCIRVQEGTGQNYLARTHGNGYVTDKPRMNVPRLRSRMTLARLAKQRPEDAAARNDNLPINIVVDRDAETAHWHRLANIDISDLDREQTDSDPNRHNEFMLAQRNDSSLASDKLAGNALTAVVMNLLCKMECCFGAITTAVARMSFS